MKREEKWREIDHNHVQILGQVAKDRESIQGHFKKGQKRAPKGFLKRTHV